ncbi:MAG: class I SAM-dependent methyltransferase [Candidatus Korarchaeota archaeon]|nr:class I SAM-dependent methyltransferase [Candidatus Korarchaeota archaeon]
MKRLESELDSIYSLLPWNGDPYTPEGRKRYERALKEFSELKNHPFFSELSEEPRILDILSGEGIGGVALSKTLGGRVRLYLMDLREKALEVAKRFSREELGEEGEILVHDATRVHEVLKDLDLVLMYGLSTPHFAPWRAILLLASIRASLKDNGVLLVEEADRRYWVFYMTGYKDIIAEFKGDEPILSMHKGYDFKRGTFRRAHFSLLRGKMTELEVYLWGVADFLSLMWLFFEEVDLRPLDYRRFMLLARRPRRKLRPEDLKLPSMLL